MNLFETETTDQLPLPLPLPPLARATDPPTSQLAAEEIVPNLAALHRWAAECVAQRPGRTQRELGAEFCPLDLRKIGRRLNELAKAGVLKRGPVRKCSISGRPAETWYPVQGET
jgi:hypothetical protein